MSMDTTVSPAAGEQRNTSWTGMYVGPATVTGAEFAELTERLVRLRPDQLAAAADRELRFGLGRPGVPGVLLYTATPAKDTLGAALDEFAAGRPGVDWPTIVEARSVHLAQRGDLLVGRSGPWRAAAGDRLTALVPDTGHFYFMHTLLVLAAGGHESLRPIVEHVRRHPEGAIRVYTADDPTIAFLLWLRRQAGLARLTVEANHPGVFESWSHKAVLHPRVDEAGALPAADDPHAMLAAETALTPLSRELGVDAPRLPGYTLPADLPFDSAFRKAAALLGERFGLTRGCLKAAKSSSGQGITTDIDLTAGPPVLPGPDGGDWVLEARADYLRLPTAGHEFLLAPSVHLRRGAPADGMTLQFLEGTCWQGNVYFDRRTCSAVGVTTANYDRIRSVLVALHERLSGRGLVNGGLDFAIARLGGCFGDATVVGLQDLNLSACGADLLRAFQSSMRTRSGPCSAATRVVMPPAEITGTDLRAILDSTDEPAAVLACIPGQWAMVAAGGHGPIAAAETVCRLAAKVPRPGNSLVGPLFGPLRRGQSHGSGRTDEQHQR